MLPWSVASVWTWLGNGSEGGGGVFEKFGEGEEGRTRRDITG